MASCQGEYEDKPHVPIHCGHKKGAWYDHNLLVSPLMANCVDFFRYSGSGEILPIDNPAQKNAAQTTINQLALNINKLQNMRKAAIDAILLDIEDLSVAEIQMLAQGYVKPDKKGQYIPFCATIAYFFQEYSNQIGVVN
jgi:hypothetical protein